MNERQQSVHKKLARIRKPRVHITYELEGEGAVTEGELPFVVGVLANLSGDQKKRPLRREARFREIHLDNFEDLLRSIQPRLALDICGEIIELSFATLSDFEPQSLAAGVPFISEVPDDESERRLRSVLHHPRFRGLEATWRSLWSLITRTETGTSIRIQILDVSKRELLLDLDRATEFDQSRLFKLVYEEPYGTYGGLPFAALVGDYQFSHIPEDIDLLRRISAVAAAAHAPFIAGASSALFGLESFGELPQIRNLERLFDSVEYTAWNAFRNSEDSQWVALTAPRVLLRRPHVWNRENPQQCTFHEAQSSGSDEFLWGNAAFALAACMTASFAQQNWCSSIQGLEGGGLVRDLPTWYASDATGKICTETVVSDRRELELSDCGIVTLLSRLNSEHAVFFSVPTCQRPRQYDNDSATRNARTMARLPTLLACARFAHYLKVICRNRIGSFFERGDYERYLNKWIDRYVTQKLDDSPVALARYPLDQARIDVSEVEGSPGHYRAVVYLRPRLGVAELQTSVRMVVSLPTI